MVQEMLRYPGASGIVEESRWMTYNAMGWKATESSWGDGALVTVFSEYDRFGRVGKIQPQGTNPASEISYQGDRVVTRKVEIATGATGQRTPSYTTEIYDGFGRLERVCEGQPTAWTGNCGGVETVYEYDESGNLVHVYSAATESGCGQERFFNRSGPYLELIKIVLERALRDD